MTERFPFPLPNGWFQIAHSDEVAAGDVRPLRYFGTDLVLFRTESGSPCLLDAFCAHLGAHLGHGGVVEGDRIRCPFHAWEFDGGGMCRKVPYAKRIPAKARMRVWPCMERNQMLWAWYHRDGSEPTWEVPDLAEASDPDWTDFKRHRWTIKTQNQEIGENAVDRAHFRYVHGTKDVPESEVHFDGHIRRAAQRVKLDTPRGPVDGAIEVEAHGMGCTITRFTGICETVLLLSHTPVDEETVDSRFSFTQQKVDGEAPKGGVAAAIIKDIVKQMNEDIPIWENKRYLERPMLCDGDGPIAQYRKWCEQFCR